MNKADFLSVYQNPNKIHIVKYREKYTRDILQGRLLDGIQLGIDGKEFLMVDNFSNRILLENVIEVVDTGKDWSTAS